MFWGEMALKGNFVQSDGDDGHRAAEYNYCAHETRKASRRRLGGFGKLLHRMRYAVKTFGLLE